MSRLIKNVSLIILFIASQLRLSAQIYSSKDSLAKPLAFPKEMIKKPKPITKESSVGLRLNTDGWTFVYENGQAKTPDLKKVDKFHNVRLIQFEFTEHRHPKELRMFGWDIDRQSDKKYVFGKVNNFYALKFNYGHRKLIAGKPFPHSVSVHWVYAGGLSIGLLKPYYVDAYISKDGGNTFERTNTKFESNISEYFLNPLYIIGASGMSYGIGEIKIKPGIHLKSAFHFDYAADKFLVSAIEVGGTAEFYSSKIELMANQKAYPYFFNLYAGIQFGNRRR